MKIAVWGLGDHAIKNILPAIKEVDGLNLLGVYSRNKEKVSFCADQYNCKSWTTSQEMLSDKALDIVFLSTPPGLHFSQGKEILTAGKHFWCEKPLTLSSEDTKEIIELSSKLKLSVCEGFMYLYHPHFLKVKEYIKKKRFGKIHSIKLNFGLPTLENPGFRKSKDQGGSCLYDVGSYPLSALLDLFPHNDFQVLSARLSFDRINSVDYKGFANILIDSSFNAHLEWSYDVAYRNFIDIWGHQGAIQSDKIFSKDKYYAPVIKLSDINGNETNVDIEATNHFALMLKSFLTRTENKGNSDLDNNNLRKLSELLEGIKNF